MKIRLDVKDRQEGAAIQRALADPETRACVVTLGHLLSLSSDRARERVLRYVAEWCAEQDFNVSPLP